MEWALDTPSFALGIAVTIIVSLIYIGIAIAFDKRKENQEWIRHQYGSLETEPRNPSDEYWKGQVSP